jgi:hypothetical protein
MRWLSTEAVIFNFEGGLSTDLNGSYSQGLIHRKQPARGRRSAHGQAAIKGNPFKK